MFTQTQLPAVNDNEKIRLETREVVEFEAMVYHMPQKPKANICDAIYVGVVKNWKI